jgi:hypothetical protein
MNRIKGFAPWPVFANNPAPKLSIVIAAFSKFCAMIGSLQKMPKVSPKKQPA